MKILIHTFALLSLTFILTGCAARLTETPVTEPYSDDQIALHTLVTFLEGLHNDKYEDAAELYGGTYETMIDHNPSVDPGKRGILLQNACTINGAECLEVKSTGLDQAVSANEYHFKVDFLNEDGSLFVLGPCCGGNQTDTPPQSVFIFRVIKNSEGKFLVLDMPPYMP